MTDIQPTTIKNCELSFSVIIPSYNRNEILIKAIKSVANQTHLPQELIIVDDGSNFPISLDSIVLPFPIICIRLSKNRGAAIARNIAARKAKGDILAFLDSDDMWSPPYLHLTLSQYHKLQVDATYSYVVTTNEGDVVNRTSNRKSENNFTSDIILKNYIQSLSGFTVRRKVFLDLQGFREDLILAEDLDFYIRLSFNHRIGLVPYFLVHRFLGKDNLVLDINRWSRDVRTVHMSLFQLKEFSCYRGFLAFGVLTRLLRLKRRTKSFSLKRLLVLIEMMKCMPIILTKEFIGFLSNQLYKSSNFVNNINKNCDFNIHKKIDCVIQLNQNTLLKTSPFFDALIPNIIGGWIEETKAIGICVPLSISKINDERLPLSIVATTPKSPLPMLLDTLPHEELAKIINNSKCVITSDKKTIGYALSHRIPVLAINCETDICQFSLLCDNHHPFPQKGIQYQLLQNLLYCLTSKTRLEVNFSLKMYAR